MGQRHNTTTTTVTTPTASITPPPPPPPPPPVTATITTRIPTTSFNGPRRIPRRCVRFASPSSYNMQQIATKVEEETNGNCSCSVDSQEQEQQQQQQQRHCHCHCQHQHQHQHQYQHQQQTTTSSTSTATATWYTSCELEEIRSNVRDHCQRIQKQQEQQQQQQQQQQQRKRMRTSIETDFLSHNDNDRNDATTWKNTDVIRGLEQRLCKERQRRKYISIKYIVRTASKLRTEEVTTAVIAKSNGDHNNNNNNNNTCNVTTAIAEMSASEKLALVAQRCNSWATTLAIAEASRDFILAYSEDDCDNVVADTTATAIASTNNTLSTTNCKSLKRYRNEEELTCSSSSSSSSSSMITRNIRSKTTTKTTQTNVVV